MAHEAQVRYSKLMDHITKDQLLSSLTTRVAECEQKVKAIGQTTEVLIGTKVGNRITYDDIGVKGKTMTLATFGSEVAFIRIVGTKILRGSSYRTSLWGNDSGTCYGLITFQSNGMLIVKDDSGGYVNIAPASEWRPNISYYKYAV